MTPDDDPWEVATLWFKFASEHPMAVIPFAHTLVLDGDCHVTLTLRLWQWIDCGHGGERQWLLRAVDEPGTTATGQLAYALARAYSSLESRWGMDSPGWEYAAAVDEALQLDTYRATNPPTHPYAIPRCNSCAG